MSPYHAQDVWRGEDGTTLDTIYLSRVHRCQYQHMYAYKAIQGMGTHVAFSTDGGSGGGLSPMEPLLTIHAAVTRERWVPDQDDPAVTVMQAVDCYTREAAYAEGMDDVKGRIQVGMLADMVLLSGDVFHPDYDTALLRAEVPVLTVCDGRAVYSALRGM